MNETKPNCLAARGDQEGTWVCDRPTHGIGTPHRWVLPRHPVAPEPAPEPDMVAHPPHYKHPSGIECITVVEHMTFLRGNAMKYLWRAGSKGGVGQKIEDLRKAVWYIEREIANLTGKLMDEQGEQEAAER